jgi:hypothetical protein
MVSEERKEWNSVATTGAVAIERNEKKYQYRKVCLGKKDIIHILLDYLGTSNWRIQFLYDK